VQGEIPESKVEEEEIIQGEIEETIFDIVPYDIGESHITIESIGKILEDLGLPSSPKNLPLNVQIVRMNLYKLLLGIQDKLKQGMIPYVDVKTRTRSNLIYVAQTQTWKLNNIKHTRKTLKTKGGAKEILKIVKMVVFLIHQLEIGKSSTLREIYYNALNWTEQAQFQKIDESNTVLQNIEVLLDCIREDFKVYPNSEGKLYGNITLKYKTRDNEFRTVHCQRDVTKSGFLLPRSIQQLQILEVNTKNLLVVETDGCYNRCIEERFDETGDTAIIVTAGYASRMVKTLIRLLQMKYGLKVRIFCDGDAHGCMIARNIISGSIKSSHLSDRLCTPKAIHIGLFPSQVKKYELPTYPITAPEMKMLEIMINDPMHEDIKEELLQMKQTRRKAEQQSLSFHGFEHITSTFLPQVLKQYQDKA